MYQVLARKWRPQNFEELVGQKHVVRTLANAIGSNRLAHAYIFAGLRGTGKTTVARILAKCLNCEQGPTTTPCSRCDACVEIAESRAMDVLEIDAASRTGVDNVRELQEIVSYAPSRDRYRVLIIDEAHMLSKQAFNALLKTLEEPPPNVIFLLATTEPQKILPTIHSRCQVYEFRRVAVGEVAAHLRRLCDSEKLTISDVALERVARAGEGSVRDSLSVLERVVAFCGTEVDDDDVLRLLGGVRTEVLVAWTAALAARDAGAMLAVLDGLVDEGHDLLHFWGELVSLLRDLMLMRAAPDQTSLLGRSVDEATSLSGAAGDLTLDDLARAFNVTSSLELGLKSSSQPRFLFEATLIRLASLGSVRPIEEVLAGLSGGAPPPARPSPPARSTEKKKPALDRPGAATDTPPRGASPVAPAPAPDRRAPRQDTGDPASRLVASIGESRPMVGSFLEQARVEFAGDSVTIRGRESLLKPLGRNVELIQKHAERIGGGPVKVEIVFEDDATPAVVGGTPAGKASEKRGGGAPGGRTTQARLLEDAKNEPGVKKLLRNFGAQVVEIRPLENTPDIPAEETE